MTCQKCGGVNKETVKFCAFCGEAMGPTPAAASQAAAPAGEKSANEKKQKMIGMAACAVVAIVLVGVLVSFLGGSAKSAVESGSAKSAAENYYRAMVSGDIKKALGYSAYNADKMWFAMRKDWEVTEKAFKQAMRDKYDVDSINALYAKLKKEGKASIRGVEVEISVKAKDVTKFTDNEAEEELASLSDEFSWSLPMDMDPFLRGKVKGMATVAIELAAQVDGEKETRNVPVLVGKVGGKWRVFDLNALIGVADVIDDILSRAS